MLVCKLIFKLSDFTGIKQKKSTKNKEFYLLFIPIIFKNFMKISIFRFHMTIERLKLISIHKNKVYSMFPSNFIREIKQLVFCGTRLKTHRLLQVDIDRREQCCAANYEQVVNHVVPSYS